MSGLLSGKSYRLAAVATHPIQYQAPLWRALAHSEMISLKVFFASRHGLENSLDPGFGQSFAWDIPLIDGYRHEFLPSVRLPVFGGPVANLFPTGLIKKLKEGDFDAVLVNGYATGAAWSGIQAAWRLRIPVLMRGDTHEHGRIPSIRHYIKRIILPRLLNRIDGFLAVGSWNREYWRSYGVAEGKMETALFAVDNDFFFRKCVEQDTIVTALRASWNATEEDVVFLYSAKLIPAKSPEILLKAFALLAEPRARLVFVGSGQLESSLKELQKDLKLDRVHWEGFVNQTKLPAYYRAADILVLPSRWEPWGLVVNEAMACGTPCIVSDVVGAGPDLVQSGPTGLIFRHNDPRSLADAMRSALSKENRRQWTKKIPEVIHQATYRENVKIIQHMLSKLLSKKIKCNICN